MKIFFSLVFTISSILYLINCQGSEKQIKVSACMKIFKSRIALDSLYFQTFIDFLSQGADKDEATNKILSLCLLTCYSQIEFYKADEINRKYRDFKRLPAMESEYKELIGLEKWYDIFSSNDRERLQAEMTMLEDAAREIKSEDLNFDESSIETNYESQEEQDIYVNREKKVDLNIFGLNLTQLDATTKNIIGISLIISVFLAVLYGLNWIKNLRENNSKNKKKKNK